LPQARLPDINTQFIKFINKAVTSLDSKNYEDCIGSCYSVNALLASDYQITISTKEYENRTNLGMSAHCKFCTEKFDFRDLKIIQMVPSVLYSSVSGAGESKIWYCPSCDKENNLSETKLVQGRLKEPHYLKVVPKPPERKAGLMSRTTYHNKFSQWFWLFMTELQSEMARFRDDNWTKKDQLFGDEDIDTSDETDD
jgi:hypothetical protein